MAGTTDISLVRDRDAQAAIRGFVYQVDLTILRWLKLDDADLLLPERAEDIDIIAQWMNGGDEQLLEQVKNLKPPSIPLIRIRRNDACSKQEVRGWVPRAGSPTARAHGPHLQAGR